jgi:hypothetical protein
MSYNGALRSNWYVRLLNPAVTELEADAVRLAADEERELAEHHEASRLKKYRQSRAALASAELASAPDPAPLPPDLVAVVPDPALVAAAALRFRNVRSTSAVHVDPSRNWGGGVRL